MFALVNFGLVRGELFWMYAITLKLFRDSREWDLEVRKYFLGNLKESLRDLNCVAESLHLAIGGSCMPEIASDVMAAYLKCY